MKLVDFDSCLFVISYVHQKKNSLSFPFLGYFDALLPVPDCEGPAPPVDFPLPAQGIGTAAVHSGSLFQIPVDRWHCTISLGCANRRILPSEMSLFPVGHHNMILEMTPDINYFRN